MSIKKRNPHAAKANIVSASIPQPEFGGPEIQSFYCAPKYHVQVFPSREEFQAPAKAVILEYLRKKEFTKATITFRKHSPVVQVNGEENNF